MSNIDSLCQRPRRLQCFWLRSSARRVGAVRQLRYSDLILDAKPYGHIRWPAETDKTRKAWLTPISPTLPQRLVRLIRTRPGVGDAFLFPAPRDHSQPVDRETLATWLRSALKAANLPHLQGETFHGLRRKFATERKHLPDVDVAAAGGWRSVMTMKRAYQQADEAGVLRAVMDRRELRERGA